jgi:hypothetical protein
MDPTEPDAEISELEQRLLELARHDRIPAALSARMAEGLGMHVAGAALHSGVAAGSKLSAPLFAKTGLWGVLSIALAAAVATWYAAPSAPHADHAAQLERSASTAPSAIEAPAPSATNAAVAPSIAFEKTAPPADSRERLRTRPAAAGDDSALRAEVALLDGARDALRENDGARALRLLDQHRRRFARARLAPEAAALRIEALVQLGSYAQAETMSQRFLSAYPQHPLRAHVAELTAAHASALSP